ncbi:hypothetical protein EDC05_005169 [Coemansia umbellata]|uniref:Cysteine-rich transmembrane CYSTM domain-containing protein n=1 Tax=Coemansia umbellata TaxID=1424467 RepID=A0ABQ8PGX0_9FUNG|nr:hypothetical protein EDC05_005169 [Coemansia umbellata]
MAYPGQRIPADGAYVAPEGGHHLHKHHNGLTGDHHHHNHNGLTGAHHHHNHNGLNGDHHHHNPLDGHMDEKKKSHWKRFAEYLGCAVCVYWCCDNCCCCCC